MSLQKFYSKTLGERDYHISEAVMLGLRLPLIFPLLPVVSLNTFGTRQLKQPPKNPLLEDDDQPATYDSKLDFFEKRRSLIDKSSKSRVSEEELRCCSFFGVCMEIPILHGKAEAKHLAGVFHADTQLFCGCVLRREPSP